MAGSRGWPRVAFSLFLALILERGCLASRILRALGGDTGRERLREVYRRLARSLATNTIFLP